MGFLGFSLSSVAFAQPPKIPITLICQGIGGDNFKCLTPEEQCDGTTENLDICRQNYIGTVPRMTPPIALVGKCESSYRGTGSHYSATCIAQGQTSFECDYEADGPFPVRPGLDDWAYVYGQCYQYAKVKTQVLRHRARTSK